MSEDFITRLEHDLTQAMERHERRPSTVRGTLRRRRRRVPPTAVARIAIAAALVIAVALAGLSLPGREPRPARPRILAEVALGGTTGGASFGSTPTGAVAAGGSLWVSHFSGTVLAVDAGRMRVVHRIAAGGSAAGIAADAGSVWVHSAGDASCSGRLVRIDARTGRIARRFTGTYPISQDPPQLAARDGLWMRRGCAPAHPGIDRVDAGGAVTTSVAIAGVEALAAAGDDVWAVSIDGTLTDVAAGSGRIRQSWRGLAPIRNPGTIVNALVADDTGAWVISTERGVIVHVDRDRKVAEIPVSAQARSLLAKARDGLWIATTDALDRHNRLVRLDPGTGKPTATVDLGDRIPVALVPVGGRLCVVTAAGRVLFVG
jgi:PQQ-like domain